MVAPVTAARAVASRPSRGAAGSEAGRCETRDWVAARKRFEHLAGNRRSGRDPIRRRIIPGIRRRPPLSHVCYHGRHLVASKPARILQLILIDGDLLAGGIALDDATEHERVRLRPRLATKVPHLLPDDDARLLQNLPPGAVFNSLPVLEKSLQAAEWDAGQRGGG
jgi:hypothetical protein